MMPATPEQAAKTAKEAGKQAVLNGATPQEAKAIELQTYARESGGAVEAAGHVRTGTGSFAHDDSEGFWLSNGSERAFIGYGASQSDVSDFLGNSAARDLGMNYAAQVMGIRHGANAALAQGMARGEAMYVAGMRNRETTGVDFTQFNQQVDSYIQFREGQRSQFNQSYASFNGGEKFLFNAGANLFGGLISGGQALGDATALLGIQGGNAFGSAWSNVGSTLSYVAQNPVDALVINPATAAYNRYSSIYNTDGFGAAAGTLTGDLLSGVPFAAVGFAKPLNLPKADLAPLNRRMFAEDALVELGFSKGRAANYIDGIDFNHPVELVELPVGGPFAQFQPMGRPFGNFLTDIGTDINTLGIRPTGKLLTPYAPTQTIPALRSITSDIEVNWDGLPTYQAKGGGVQYIIPDKYKSMFEALYYGD